MRGRVGGIARLTAIGTLVTCVGRAAFAAKGDHLQMPFIGGFVLLALGFPLVLGSLVTMIGARKSPGRGPLGSCVVLLLLNAFVAVAAAASVTKAADPVVIASGVVGLAGTVLAGLGIYFAARKSGASREAERDGRASKQS